MVTFQGRLVGLHCNVFLFQPLTSLPCSVLRGGHHGLHHLLCPWASGWVQPVEAAQEIGGWGRRGQGTSFLPAPALASCPQQGLGSPATAVSQAATPLQPLLSRGSETPVSPLLSGLGVQWLPLWLASGASSSRSGPCKVPSMG